MSFWRRYPGDCPICGAAHTSCRSDDGPIAIVQMPARDAAAARALASAAAPLKADQATLPPGQVTTGTYRRKKRAT